ncbi:hypothetical protein FVEG_06656 [Fusarium verticillioides 7600]|uniref:Uncharacterized protein n=1 Tax=Gibberella moniliformis (strain M3125 / FGSC 7600) TaxID=334819 RepID=W7MEM3_GIBM7|nr:hypothetical protein FVEG_06656 [Fusarium verticillioides 7600]EWG46060.1 hypothetical protein FVEG_06656 [Fusarium verticillioides 7600]
MAGPRRPKRLQSCSKPDQDKVPKIARASKDQGTTDEVVQGENKKIGESAMEGPLDPGVGRPSPEDASSKDAFPNRASEGAPKFPLQGRELLKDMEQRDAHAQAERNKYRTEGLGRFQRALQWDVGLGYRQGYLFELWNYFGGHIRGFTKLGGFLDLPWDRLDEAVQQRFIGYSPCARELFEVRLVRQFMFERWIWEIIDENFFTAKSQDIEWTSPYWEAQATMERFLREKNFQHDEEFLRYQYPNWRFTTISFYYTLKERSNRKAQYFREARIEPRCVVKILKKALGQYFPENPGLFEEEISIIANVVAEFELLFDCGRQTLRLMFHDPNTKEACGFPFSAKAEGFDTQVVMRSVGPEGEADLNGLPVQLVVSPMLVFYGNKDGWDYHVPAVAVPMRVCVGYLGGCEQDEVVETDEDGEGDGEEVAKIIKDKEGVTKDEDGKNIEDEDEE